VSESDDISQIDEQLEESRIENFIQYPSEQKNALSFSSNPLIISKNKPIT